MGTPKYYKVVYEASSGRLLSSWTADNNFAVEYKLNEFVYPKLKNSKLFVFDDFSEAMAYWRSIGDSRFKIFECEVLNPTAGQTMCYENSDKYESFWNHSKSNIITKSCLPATIFCDAVKLIKKIDS